MKNDKFHKFEINHLIEELNLLDISKKNLISEHIYRYALRLEGCKTLKKLALEFKITGKVLKLKKKLDNSHYVLVRFWRAVYSRVIFKTDFNYLVIKYNVNLTDLTEAVKFIYPNDDIVIYSKKKYLSITKNNNDFIVKSLLKSIKERVYRKLYFIYKYQNLDAEDFVSEIVTSIVRTLTKLDYIDDCTKLIIGKRIIKQEIANIISKYTTLKRNRLVKCKNRGYKARTLSMDSPILSQNKEINMHDILEYNNNSTSNILKKIRKRVSDEEKLYIDIKTGKIKIPPHTKVTNLLNWNEAKVNNFRKKVINIINT